MDKVVLVDIYDNILGLEEKITAHKKGLLHRAFSLYIINKNKMLIQRRALTKYHSPGIWANACCSHPVDNMNIYDFVVKRTKEELGIDIDKPQKIFDFIYYSEYSNGLTEYELDNVFLVAYDGVVNFNKDEICEIDWIDLDVLEKDLVENPKKYSTWFLASAPRVLRYLKNNK